MLSSLATAPRLFAPDQPTFDRPELNLTLPELFHTRVVPVFRILSVDGDSERFRRNLRYYYGTLKRWGELMPDVPIGAVDEQMLALWRDRLLACERVESVATLHKHWSYLRGTLKQLKELGVIPRVPQLRLPKFIRRPGEQPVILGDTWSALWRGCTHWLLSTDSRLPGPLVGRGALIWFYSTGLRAGDVWSLNWEDLYLQPHCPVRNWAFLRNPHGWLWINADKTGKPALIPLTACARGWVNRVAELLPEKSRSGQLLPVGNPDTQSAADKERQAMRRQVHRAAGMDYLFTFKDLRDGANEAWNEAEPDAGCWLLGHAANFDVNTRHYQTGIRRLLRAVENLKTPAAFLHGEL